MTENIIRYDILRDAAFDPSVMARFAGQASKAVKAGSIPGMTMIILRGGKIVYNHTLGHRDVETRQPLDPNAIFRMYSQTKTVTAVLAMRLHEEGLLMLDDPVSKYLPEFANMSVIANKGAADKVRGELSIGAYVEPARREMTILDLLTMTSGVANRSRSPATLAYLVDRPWHGSGFLAQDPRPINDPEMSYEEIVLSLARLPLHAHPGTTWQYGSDFDVLTLLLERASGERFDDLMTSRILAPLGMVDSGFYAGPDQVDRLGTEHQWNAQGEIIVRDRPATAEKVHGASRRLISGNGLFGAMLSTPDDFTRFALMLMGRGSLGDTRIIGRKSFELMTTDHLAGPDIDIVVGPGYGFGLGYAVRRSLARSAMPGSVGSFGWGGAAGTWMFIDPKEDLAGLFFTHVFGYQFSANANLFFRFEKAVYEALL